MVHLRPEATSEQGAQLKGNATIGGRPCVVQSIGRVRSKVGRRFYSLMSVRFLDNGEYHSMGAGEFAAWSTRLDRAFVKSGGKTT